MRDIARSSYCVEFPNDTDISEQVLWPQAPAESHGMEDARFVRFTDDRGEVRYYATYTAFDGIHVSQQLLETTDFATFSVSPIGGAAATGKGLALFPRQIRGRYVALSRSDRETNSIAFSDDLRSWDRSETIQIPEQTWEILQLGNCGSPIETDAGWLVITHGVGPMRTYSLGAVGWPDPLTRQRSAGRLRSQRRLLVRQLRAQRHTRPALRRRRSNHLNSNVFGRRSRALVAPRTLSDARRQPVVANVYIRAASIRA
jgi:hypothetical protein